MLEQQALIVESARRPDGDAGAAHQRLADDHLVQPAPFSLILVAAAVGRLVHAHQVEEIEHILTDLIFIRDGKIALSASMDAIAERYIEVMVAPDAADAARAMNPINERQIFGKSIFLFDGVARARLAELGELHKPSISDLFVATMKGTYA